MNEPIGTEYATELRAMSATAAALSELDRPARERVLQWAADAHGVKVSMNSTESLAEAVGHFEKWVAAVNETSRRLGGIPPDRLIAAITKVADEAEAEQHG